MTLTTAVRRSRAAIENRSPIIHELLTGNRGPIHAYLFELAAAIGYTGVGAANLTNPHDIVASPVGRIIHPWDLIWSAMYITAGLAIAYGVLRPSLRVRASGLIGLASALTMQVIAALTYQPDARVVFNVLFAAACLARAGAIVQLTRRLRRSVRP